MEGLRPEVDELDRFQKRSEPKAKVDAPKEPKLQPVSGQKAASTMSVTLFALILIVIVTVFAWFSWKQQIEITGLKTQLGEASGVMDQSKLLIARLEGKLSETGVELAESGTAAEKKMEFLDSEMRKLWGVAYDRNKKAIEENLALIKDMETKLTAAQKEQADKIKEVSKDIAAISDDLKKQIGAYDGRLSGLANDLSALRTSQNSISSDVKDRLAEQKKMVDAVKKDSQGFLERTAKLDLSIESINASRRQLNERIVDMERKINELQLKNTGPTN